MCTDNPANPPQDVARGKEGPRSPSTPSPPGWYADPSDHDSQRYFDGTEWTSLEARGPTYQATPFEPGAPELATVPSPSPSSTLAHMVAIWSGYGRVVRGLITSSVLAGITLVVVGVSGDYLHWWTGLSFTPNA